MSDDIAGQLRIALERAIKAEHSLELARVELEYMRQRAESAEAKLNARYSEPDGPEVLALREEEVELEAKRAALVKRKDELEREMGNIRLRIRTTKRLPDVEYKNLCTRQQALGEQI